MTTIKTTQAEGKATTRVYDNLDKCLDDRIYSIQSTLRGHPPTKKPKTPTEQLVPITFGWLKMESGKEHCKTVKILLDSGASATLVSQAYASKLHKQREKETQWTTMAGSFLTRYKVDLQIILPEFSESKTIVWNAHVTETLGRYDMIIGRDLLIPLGIDICFSDCQCKWEGITISMKPESVTMDQTFYVNDSKAIKEATNRIKNILEAKYEPADLDDIVFKSSPHLTRLQQMSLRKLLEKYKSLFDGSLGTWKGKPYHIELKEGAQPYHARCFPIPKAHEATLQDEVNRLVHLGVLKKVNRSEWAAPTFIIPKKDGSVRFISDFRQLNLQIRRKPFPIPKIQDLLLKLEGFQYATSLDLNMGYYHIELSPFSKQLCTIVLPWGKYEYQRLPMGLCNSPDIFQEKMSTLMADLEFCRAYIDDLLVLTTGDWDLHLHHLDTVLQRLSQTGLKVNAKKSFFGKPELEYLGYWITKKGIQPITKKVDAIKNIAVPKTRKEL